MILGILFVLAGLAGIFTKTLDIGTGLSSIAIGGMFIYTFGSVKYGRYEINSSVKNRIVAQDRQGRYLVEAHTSRQITGPRPHVQGNMPANLYEVKKGLWIVDTNQGAVWNGEKIQWEPVNGNFSLEPRGNQPRDFLADEMTGWEHNYIKGNDNGQND